MCTQEVSSPARRDPKVRARIEREDRVAARERVRMLQSSGTRPVAPVQRPVAPVQRTARNGHWLMLAEAQVAAARDEAAEDYDA